REHVLKLPAQLRCWDFCSIRPLSFREMHVAVPKPCHNRQPRAVDQLGGWRNLHDRTATDGNYLPATDEHHSIANGHLRRTDINRAAHQRQVAICGGRSLTKESSKDRKNCRAQQHCQDRQRTTHIPLFSSLPGRIISRHSLRQERCATLQCICSRCLC